MTSPHSTLKSNDLPEAYAIGWVPFLGAKIYLDSHPLIPRTETEWWVEEFIRQAKARAERTTPSALRVLDLFAGSGCIGVAVLMHVPSAHVDFGEVDARHLPTIERNIRENGIDLTRVCVIRTNVYSDLRNHYDYVLANPPYLTRARLARIENSVLEHEPPNALFAGDDGFELIEKTISGLPTHLAPGGQCWIEHEPEHAAKIMSLAQKLGLSAATHNDQYGASRYSVILKP